MSVHQSVGPSVPWSLRLLHNKNPKSFSNHPLSFLYVSLHRYSSPSIGTVFKLADVFCFTYFLSGFLFRVRGRIEVGVGGGFRVRVRVRASVRAK